MYLMDSTIQSVNNRKWNLGRLAMAPVRLRGVVNASSSQPWRMRGLGRLGQDSPDCPGSVIDPYTGELCANLPGTPGAATGTVPRTPVFTDPITGTVTVVPQNPSPVAGGGNNSGITLPPTSTPSQSPLDYTSPQAAIAAGLDPTTVYNAWSKALARFPSPQAAISAGIPAGVVNQLWQQSNVAAANAAAKSASSIPWGMIGLGAGALVLLSALGGKRRR
jgi:hypothetical protein